jgi:ketosteroid isomerase-like protein
VTGEPVLHLQSWRQGFVELAIYADGRVIWGFSSARVGYLQMRLTPEGVERLRGRAVSTGLFEHDFALGLDLRFRGHMEVRRGDRSVIVGWGRTPVRVSGLGIEDRFVDATPAQAGELIELEAFFRDPVASGLPPRMYVQPEASPFVPTHLWVSWDHHKPDPSELPSPAREVLIRNLETVLGGGCWLISIAQAHEIAQAMERAGFHIRALTPVNLERLIEPDDVRDGIAFDMPGQGGTTSFFHAHPALPHESTCD